MKVIRLAILGLGNVPLAVLRYMEEPGPAKTLKEAGIAIQLTGVTTGSRGNAINPDGIPFQDLVAIGKSGRLEPLNKGPETSNSLEFVKAVPADILFVATPASIPSVEEIKLAFARGIHVVTSNKTPVANHFRELTQDAKKHGVGFRFGATVLAGYPPWAQFFEAVSKQPITELQIVVNATSNNILTMMLEQGMSFEQGIAEAQRLGIAEREPSDDVDGHDTQKKLAILANVLLDANLTPADIPTVGIRGVTLEQLKQADQSGKWIQLLGRAWFEKGQVKAEVKPVETDNPFFVHMRSTSMGLYFQTPTADPGSESGTSFGIRLDLGSGDQAIMATAAGVFEDILTIASMALQG
ncbi:MAG: hypothetical protein HYW51_03535 [Candidatus Doudnabacteria bacterium]|nr:hypothetical protein [Candidatus Doudnabacteria bacterium]